MKTIVPDNDRATAEKQRSYGTLDLTRMRLGAETTSKKAGTKRKKSELRPALTFPCLRKDWKFSKRPRSKEEKEREAGKLYSGEPNKPTKNTNPKKKKTETKVGEGGELKP